MDGPSTGRSSGPSQRKIITRSQSLKRKSKSLTPVADRVQLERVLGFTCNCNATLACDPNTGLIAYPAGCVVVLLNPKKNKQTHIQSKKTVTCLAFSGDGRHLVTGECGYQPMVRVWDVEERTQVGEFAGHKFGINCVIFSPNLKHIISIGSQHDMSVVVWNWKTSTKLASNKVAAKVTDISFSEDGSYFVTVGNRHVKFWYLDTSKSKVKEVVPLNGRSGILGEQRNNFFCGVACGRGANSAKTFAVTQSGLLCEFNDKRLLDKWVELRVSSAQCLTVSDQHIYSGCAEGVVRVFNASTLHYVTSLPKPHYLGVDVTAGRDASNMPAPSSDARFPDCAAIRYDTTNKKVTTVYNDHSMYVWDVSNLKKVGKARSYMYHSACIWGVEVYPQLEETKSVLPPGSFITCSSDDTIRIWNVDSHQGQDVKRNIYSQELLKVIYTDPELNNIKDVDFNPAGKNDKTDTQCLEKNGVRCVKVSPDGQHLASGDRMGNIRIHELQFMDQIQEVEAHDSEVLCLEFTRPETGVRLLASAGRDRLIHVFDMDQQYSLVQTLDDHSSAITAVHFAEQDGQLHMLSCGADKSILFRTAQQDPEFGFVLNRHLVGRTTLYDMDIDVTHKFVATACQDRNVRIYNIKNGKQKKSYKGSSGDDGTLIKVQLDPSGGYVATSCSNKTLAIMDFFTGECVSTMFGHSELVTGVRFTNDLKHLISVAADGCIFVWRLPLEFTQNMTARMVELGKMTKEQLVPNMDVRRGTFLVSPKSSHMSMSKSMGHLDKNENRFVNPNIDLMPIDNQMDKVDNNANEPSKMEYRVSMGQLPAWAKRTAPPETSSKTEESNNPTGPRGRWAQRVDNQGIIMKSMLDENSAIQLSLAGAMDRRRYTVEQDSIQEQIKAMRETIKTDKHVPIITDDDETNKDDEDDDDEFCSTREMIEKRLNGDNDPSRKIDSMITARRGSDETFNNHKALHKTGSIDLLLDEDEDEDEDEEGDADSDQKEVIYFPPDGDGSESSETIASSFRVWEGDTQSYKDAESEGTDPHSLSDDESAPPTPTTPGDPIKDFISQAEREFEDLGSSPALKETFTNSLDELEESGSNDPSRYFNHRLSISSRFISRSQTQHLRNIAMAAQRAQSGTNGGWKHDDDAVPEKDSSPNPVSQRPRPKLEPPPPPAPAHLGREDAQRTRHSLGPDTSRKNNTEEKDLRSRRSMDSSKLTREWKSMADMSGRITPTLTKPAALPARSRTPTYYRSTAPQRSHSPVRYGNPPLSTSAGGRSSTKLGASCDHKMAKTELKLDSTSRGRSLSTKDEEAQNEVVPQQRSKSATPLDNSSKRKSLPKSQPSYLKQTTSSNAKTGPTTSPAKGRFANKKSGGKLNSAMKSKFKSTPDLASMKTEELQLMPSSKTAEDIQELSQQQKRTVRRSMPAMREMKDPFGVNKPAVDADDITSKQVKTDRKVSIGESKVITEGKVHRRLPTPGGGNAPMPPSALVKSQSDVSIVSKTRLSNEDDEDRLKMPPPSLPMVSGIKRLKEKELTLAQAKAILQGEAGSDPPSAPSSAKSSPEKEKTVVAPVSHQQKKPQLSLTTDSVSLDVPLEGSPDKETPAAGVFNRWSPQEVMPMDLPVKDQSPSRFSWSTRRYGRMSGLNKPSVGEFDDGGDDLAGEHDPAEGDADDVGGVSSRRASEPVTVGMLRQDHSQSPLRESLSSVSSTASNSSLSSPTRGRASLPFIPPRDRKVGDHSNKSPASSGSTSPSHGSPRMSRRHLRRGDEGPLPISHDLQVAFSGDLSDSMEDQDAPPYPLSLPPEGRLSIPKSKSMPEVGTENKALDELCQSVTAKLDALVNKPLPGRSPKTPPQPADRPETWRKRLSDPVQSASGGAPDGEGDASEIKRPDKSRTMPPTSLTTSLPNAQTSAKLVLTSPAPADRSRLSLPVNKVSQPSEPEPDDDACKKAAEDLKRALDLAIQTFNMVPKESNSSQILKDSLISTQSTLNDTLGSTGASANVDRIVIDTARQAANQTAQELSDQLLDILKSRIDQALQ